MKVSRYNYRQQFGETFPEVLNELGQMLLDGRYVLSGEVSAFETAFAEYVGVRHVRGVNSGTDALLLALRALGIGPGDEVITHANTFHATVAAIHLSGARPVLVDVDENTFLPDPAHFEAAISPRTRVIIPVHLFGKPVSMTPLVDLSSRKGLDLIEDAAQAHGARFDGGRVGSFGRIGCFSFHPSKNLAAAGDAGAIATNDAEVDQTIRRMRSLGQEEQNQHVVVGINSKLDALQARILLHKLPLLDQWNAARRGIADLYRERLTDLPLQFQATGPREEHVYHLFQARTDQRNDLLAYLIRQGVDAVVRYPVAIHRQPAFAAYGWRQGEFPVSERLADELLCLPIRPDLSEGEIDYVCTCVREFFSKPKR